MIVKDIGVIASWLNMQILFNPNLIIIYSLIRSYFCQLHFLRGELLRCICISQASLLVRSSESSLIGVATSCTELGKA